MKILQIWINVIFFSFDNWKFSQFFYNYEMSNLVKFCLPKSVFQWNSLRKTAENSILLNEEENRFNWIVAGIKSFKKLLYKKIFSSVYCGCKDLSNLLIENVN